MTPPLEKTVVKNIMLWLKTQPETYCFKTNGNALQMGQPDIIGCMRGRALALEVKRPDGKYKATPLQLRILEQWRAAGAIAGVVTSVEDVKELLTQSGNW